MTYKGICSGGPHDGDIAECEEESFIVELKVHPDVQRADGTWERQIDYDTYRWVSETGTWRWGAS